MLNDLAHWFGGDLSITNVGDLATVTGDTRTQQRILRRLLTNPGDYVFEPTYGAGLPAMVGQAIDVASVSALIRAQVLAEESVARLPLPVVSVHQSSDGSTISVDITYTDSASGRQAVLSFTVNS